LLLRKTRAPRNDGGRWRSVARVTLRLVTVPEFPDFRISVLTLGKDVPYSRWGFPSSSGRVGPIGLIQSIRPIAWGRSVPWRALRAGDHGLARRPCRPLRPFLTPTLSPVRFFLWKSLDRAAARFTLELESVFHRHRSQAVQQGSILMRREGRLLPGVLFCFAAARAWSQAPPMAARFESWLGRDNTWPFFRAVSGTVRAVSIRTEWFDPPEAADPMPAP